MSVTLEADPFGDDFEADLDNDEEFGDRAARVSGTLRYCVGTMTDGCLQETLHVIVTVS